MKEIRVNIDSANGLLLCTHAIRLNHIGSIFVFFIVLLYLYLKVIIEFSYNIILCGVGASFITLCIVETWNALMIYIQNPIWNYLCLKHHFDDLGMCDNVWELLDISRIVWRHIYRHWLNKGSFGQPRLPVTKSSALHCVNVLGSNEPFYGMGWL